MGAISDVNKAILAASGGVDLPPRPVLDVEQRTDWVTCYVDASFKDGEGAWGIWLRHETGRVVEGGRCLVEDHNAAELHAIAVGVATAVLVFRPFGVLVRSDSQAALGLARHDAKLNKRADLRELQEVVRNVVREPRRLRLTWVRGHQSGNGVQAYLNARVDEIAGRTRRAGS